MGGLAKKAAVEGDFEHGGVVGVCASVRAYQKARNRL